jgi:hypothetical protein
VGEVVGSRPILKQGQRLAQAEPAIVELFEESLSEEMIDDAGDESGSGAGSEDDLTLGSLAVAVGQECPDDPNAFAHVDVTGFEREAEMASRDRLTVDEQAIGADVRAAVQVDRA